MILLNLSDCNAVLDADQHESTVIKYTQSEFLFFIPPAIPLNSNARRVNAGPKLDCSLRLFGIYSIVHISHGLEIHCCFLSPLA